MWAKLLQIIGVPLAEKLVRELISWTRNYIQDFLANRKLKKENKAKAKDLKDANNKKDSIDNFNNMP